MPTGTRLTEQEIKDRIEFAKTHSYEEFGKEFGMTAGSARQFYIKHNVKQDPKFSNKGKIIRRITKEDFLAYAPTHTIVEVKLHFKVGLNTIFKAEELYKVKCLRNRKKGVHCPRNVKQSCKRTGEARDMIIELLPKFTDASIARVFGYSRETIRLIRLKAIDNGLDC